jgi:zinc and cadmium transporter
MPIIFQVLICALAGGLLSLVGGFMLMASKKRVKLAELAAAFADILPEALSDGDVHVVLLWTLAGIIVFFLLESFIGWFHSHNHDSKTTVDPVVPMVIIGDTIHNFIDGVAIAAAFLVSPTSGIIVTLAVAAHEIPQEVGEFGLLLDRGVRRRKVALINILSSLATIAAAVLFYIIGDSLDISITPALGLVAGLFIYIAASDIIPSIHSSESRKIRFQKVLSLLVGVAIVGTAIMGLHSVGTWL